MKIGVYLAIICCLFLQFSSQTNNSCSAFDQRMKVFNCYTSFNLCESGQEKTLTMTSCVETYCANYFSYHIITGILINLNQNCQLWANRTLNEVQCLSKCCGNSFQDKFTLDNLPVCVQANKLKQSQQNFLLTAALTAVLGLIVFMIVSMCVCVCIHKFKRNIYETQQRYDRENIENQADMPPVSAVRFLEKEPHEKIVWCYVQRQISVSKIDNCSICLDQKIDCLTVCNHQFHFQCIKKWLQRHQTCPMCKNQKIFPLKVICQKCGTKESACNPQRRIDQKGKCVNLLLIPKGQKITCDNCDVKKKN